MPRKLPKTLSVRSFIDDGDGQHDIRGGYVESFWLPTVGPSAFVTARRLALRLQRRPEIAVNVDELGAELGLTGSSRRGGGVTRIEHALLRLERFDLASWDGRSLYRLRLRWPTLSEQQAARLPEALRSTARPPERVARVG